jgi:hypothetical protein
MAICLKRRQTSSAQGGASPTGVSVRTPNVIDTGACRRCRTPGRRTPRRPIAALLTEGWGAASDPRPREDDKELYDEALEEHHLVDMVMPEIKRTKADSEQFGAKA